MREMEICEVSVIGPKLSDLHVGHINKMSFILTFYFSFHSYP